MENCATKSSPVYTRQRKIHSGVIATIKVITIQALHVKLTWFSKLLKSTKTLIAITIKQFVSSRKQYLCNLLVCNETASQL